MLNALPFEFTPAGLREDRVRVVVITGSGIDAEAGLPTFRGEKGYYEDKEATYLASVEALHSEPLRQWRWRRR